ncbi:MAG: hypothetical protein KDH97_12830, partial [Calditrichaeota bacterium]|nr:hypothetical protein [Calditrichota bacterium]
SASMAGRRNNPLTCLRPPILSFEATYLQTIATYLKEIPFPFPYLDSAVNQNGCDQNSSENNLHLN